MPTRFLSLKILVDILGVLTIAYKNIDQIILNIGFDIKRVNKIFSKFLFYYDN